MTDEQKVDRTTEDVLKDIEALAGEPEEIRELRFDDEAEATEAKAEKVGDQPPVEDEKATDKPDAEVEAIKEAIAKTDEADKPAEQQTVADEPGDDGKPDNKAFAAMRVANKELERQINELREQLGKVQPDPARETATEVTQPQADKVTAEDVVRTMIRAKNGEFTQPGQNEQVIKFGTQALTDELSSAELVDVYKKAQAGMFGVDSGEIADMVRDSIPLAMAREQQAAKAAQAQEVDQQKAQQAFRSELEQVRKDFPDLADDKSEMAKTLQAWDEKMIGKYDPQTGRITEKGALPEDLAMYLIAHPYAHARMVKDAYEASLPAKSELTKIKEENAQLRKRLGLVDAPERSTPSVSPEAKTNRTTDDVLRDLERLSGAAA